ncbi:undecaprenyl/decaprenyl-phosphate alpha-N-acetylglucosaminyl 1-phosphate transferase [Methylophilaceae bacterium]|nr:undecaprenyl/decaprenyl-phosphate alpha-N-acetylglucosaminyl 1-phosphate transferase [Methylophilaceae bacterium]
MGKNNLINQVVSIYGWHNLLFLCILGITLSFIFISFWKNQEFIQKFSINYEGEQRVHIGEVSRCGGLMIFISLMIFYHQIDVSNGYKYQYLLYLITPFMLLSFVEDTLNNLSFLVRLFFMIFTAFLINIYWVDAFPVIENIPIISYLLEFDLFVIVFFTLALVGLMNGANFIDGMNGLATLCFLGAGFGCITLAMIANDMEALMTIIPWLILMVCFLIFNFPYGKFFLGDSGAYLLAILLGAWIIDFFGRHQDISSWNAVLILIYPLLEVIYSASRKIIQGKSPFYPDRHHLHIKVYDIINKSTKKPLYANNATTIFLALFWLAPAILLQFVYYSQLGIVFSIILISFSYIIINYFTPSVAAEKNIKRPL